MKFTKGKLTDIPTRMDKGVLNEHILFTASVDMFRDVRDRTPVTLWIYFIKDDEALLIEDISGEEKYYARPDLFGYNGYLDDCETLDEIEDKIKWMLI